MDIQKTKEIILKHKRKLIGAGIAWKLLVALTVLGVRECTPKQEGPETHQVLHPNGK